MIKIISVKEVNEDLIKSMFTEQQAEEDYEKIKEPALKEYRKIEESALKEYQKKIKEIEDEK